MEPMDSWARCCDFDWFWFWKFYIYGGAFKRGTGGAFEVFGGMIP